MRHDAREMTKQLFQGNTIRCTLSLGVNLKPHARKYCVCKVCVVRCTVDTLVSCSTSACCCCCFFVISLIDMVTRCVLRADCSDTRHKHLDRTEVPKHRHALHLARTIFFSHVDISQCEAVFRNHRSAERFGPPSLQRFPHS